MNVVVLLLLIFAIAINLTRKGVCLCIWVNMKAKRFMPRPHVSRGRSRLIAISMAHKSLSHSWNFFWEWLLSLSVPRTLFIGLN